MTDSRHSRLSTPASWFLGAGACLLAAVLSGCGGDDTSKYRASRGETVGAGGGDSEQPLATLDPSTAGTLQGAVQFTGTPPERPPIIMSSTRECAQQHPEVVLEETVVVGPGGGLRDVFVYLEVPGRYAPPSTPAKIDQVGCMYVPHVMGVQVDQTLNIVSSDNFLHNVHYIPLINKEDNIAFPIAGTKPRSFPKPEIGIKFKCEVHPWMRAYVHVMNHPFFATTDPRGAFEIKNVPPGTYQCVFWHEKLGAQRQQITITTGQTAEVSTTYSGG